MLRRPTHDTPHDTPPATKDRLLPRTAFGHLRGLTSLVAVTRSNSVYCVCGWLNCPRHVVTVGSLVMTHRMNLLQVQSSNGRGVTYPVRPGGSSRSSVLDSKTNGAGPSLNGNGNGVNGTRAVQKEELVTIEANNSFNEGTEQVCSLFRHPCPLE